MENPKYYRLPEDSATRQVNIQTISFQDKLKLVCDEMKKHKCISDCRVLRISPDAVVFDIVLYINTNGISIDKVYRVSIALTVFNHVPLEAIKLNMMMHIKTMILEDLDLNGRA